MVQLFFPDKALIQPDYSETARYLGYSKLNAPDSVIDGLIKECCFKMQEEISPKACFCDFQIKESEKKGFVSFEDVEIESKDLENYFKNCKKVYLFAATIGPRVDLLIKKMQHLDSVKASIFQACGAMFVEKLVDLLNDEVKKIAAKENFSCKPRFSPGFGDVSLAVQKDFFRLLPCNKLGLTLMETLIMAPEKSVTGFIALKED